MLFIAFNFLLIVIFILAYEVYKLIDRVDNLENWIATLLEKESDDESKDRR